tara:strand:+ start:200 stop:904 length:705 start_codon:yes stop_codon:yes gene_type:complete
MKIAISQPTFLPWQGYFALIYYVDEFIFLDNVQFDKRSWQQRNYIKLDDKKKIFTIPVISKNKSDQKINEVKIDYKNFKVEKFLMLIKHSYKKTSYFELYYERIQKILRKNSLHLSKINQDLIIEICSMLNIKTKFYNASSMKLSNELKKTDLLREICKKKKCTQYISSYGATSYMGDMSQFPETNIKINYFEYENRKYNQIGDKFISNLTILDLIFNEGPHSLEIIRENFKVL